MTLREQVHALFRHKGWRKETNEEVKGSWTSPRWITPDGGKCLNIYINELPSNLQSCWDVFEKDVEDGYLLWLARVVEQDFDIQTLEEIPTDLWIRMYKATPRTTY